AVVLLMSNRQTRARADAATAALHIVEACRRGEQPARPDLDLMRREFADDRAFTAMMQMLKVRDVDAAIDELLARIGERLRGLDRPPAVYLRSPRAATAGPVPRFRFRLLPGRTAATATVTVASFAQPAVSWQATFAADGSCEVDAPREFAWCAGREYRWGVTLPGDAEPAAETRFTVVDGKLRDAAVARHAGTGDPGWAALAQGVELFVLDLAEDAAGLLGEPLPGEDAPLRAVRRSLLAECYALLGDAERLQALRSPQPAGR